MSSEGLSPAVKRLAVVVVLGAFMSILDTTIVNVALETLSRDLDAPLDDVQWVATAYLLALAAVIPVTAWAARRVGSRKLYIWSLVLFTAGSALCGLAWNVESLVAFRVLQAIGGGMIMPVGQMVMARTAGPQNMGRVMAVIGVPIVMAPVLGPVLGGILVQELSWEWIFFVNVPVGIVAVLAAQRLFPEEAPEPAGRLDLTGLALLATGLPLTIFGLTELGIQGTLVATQVLGPLLAGLGLTASFVAHALRSDHPLLDLRLFANRAFAAAAATTFVLGAALFGALIIVPLYYQGLRAEGAITTGLLLAPQGIGAALAMPRSGSLTDRFGGGPVTIVGIVILAAATLPFAFADPDTSYVLLCLALVVRGIGLGLAMMPAFSAAYAALTPAQVGDATPQLNVLQRIGGSFGTAILTVVLTTQLEGAASPQAGADAFNLTFLIAAVVTMLGVVPAVILTQVERRARAGRLAAARVGTEADRAQAAEKRVVA